MSTTEVTMNVYIADQIARQHADALLLEASVARRSRQARQANRARRAAAKRASDEPASFRIHVPTAGWAHRPFSMLSQWYAAGQL
jgi:hypothetical protein